MSGGYNTLLLTFHSVLRKPYTELSIGASYQIFFHLVTEFQRRRNFRNQSINQKQELSVVAMFVNESRQNEQIFLEDLP